MTFYEEVVKEFPPIKVYSSWKKEVKWVVRILKRETLKGKIELQLDIRKHVSDEKRFILTREGVYFTERTLGQFVQYLEEARKEFFNAGERARMQDTINPKKES